MVKRILDFENFVNEGLIMTYPIDKIVSYVQRKLNLTNDDVDIFFSQTNQECIAVDNSLSKSDVNKLKHMKIYIDPNAYDYIGFYTMENIKPECLKKIDEIILLKNE